MNPPVPTASFAWLGCGALALACSSSAAPSSEEIGSPPEPTAGRTATAPPVAAVPTELTPGLPVGAAGNPTSNPGGVGGAANTNFGGMGGAPESGGGMTTGGQTTGGTPAMGGMPAIAGAGGAAPIQLEGTPPPEQTFNSNGDFDLLPETPMFSLFVVEKDRVQLMPLEDANWPPGFAWREAPGRDAELNAKHLWARAELKIPLKEWYYDVSFDYCAESDGESPFALSVNGKIVAELTAEPSDNTSCARKTHTWSKIPVPEGASVQVLGKSHSNLKLEEAAGPRMFTNCPAEGPCTWAWARARWHSVTFRPSPDAP